MHSNFNSTALKLNASSIEQLQNQVKTEISKRFEAFARIYQIHDDQGRLVKFIAGENYVLNNFQQLSWQAILDGQTNNINNVLQIMPKQPSQYLSGIANIVIENGFDHVLDLGNLNIHLQINALTAADIKKLIIQLINQQLTSAYQTRFANTAYANLIINADDWDINNLDDVVVQLAAISASHNSLNKQVWLNATDRSKTLTSSVQITISNALANPFNLSSINLGQLEINTNDPAVVYDAVVGYIKKCVAQQHNQLAIYQNDKYQLIEGVDYQINLSAAQIKLIIDAYEENKNKKITLNNVLVALPKSLKAVGSQSLVVFDSIANKPTQGGEKQPGNPFRVDFSQLNLGKLDINSNNQQTIRDAISNYVDRMVRKWNKTLVYGVDYQIVVNDADLQAIVTAFKANKEEKITIHNVLQALATSQKTQGSQSLVVFDSAKNPLTPDVPFHPQPVNPKPHNKPFFDSPKNVAWVSTVIVIGTLFLALVVLVVYNRIKSIGGIRQIYWNRKNRQAEQLHLAQEKKQLDEEYEKEQVEYVRQALIELEKRKQQKATFKSEGSTRTDEQAEKRGN